MYTVTTKDGSTFVFESFEEIEEFWGEVVWAEGAEDAEVSIRFSNPSNDWGELNPIISGVINLVVVFNSAIVHNSIIESRKGLYDYSYHLRRNQLHR